MKNTCSKKKTPNPLQQEVHDTLNPFEEFKTFQFRKTEIPLDQIVQSTEVIMDQIRLGYERLLEEEAKELAAESGEEEVAKVDELVEGSIEEIKEEKQIEEAVNE